jgi:hypothetical protein
MASWTPRNLRTQFDRAARLGWLPHFRDAATAFGHDPADLLAVASRETNLDPRWLKQAGDNGNGFGLMQADKRYVPQWVATGEWRDARSGIFKGAEILKAKRDEAKRGVGKRMTVKSRNGQTAVFTGKPLASDRLRLVSFAMYNSGLWGYYHECKSGDPDRGTTGKDYSRDVNARAAHFRRWLDDTAATGPSAALRPLAAEAGADSGSSPLESAPVPVVDAVPVVEVAAVAAAPEPVPGGGPDDPTVRVTAKKSTIAGEMVAGITGIATLASGHIQTLTGMPPDVQKIVVIIAAALLALWFIGGLISRWQTREIHANAGKRNVV